MRLLIIGALNGQIGTAAKMAMARGAKVSQVDDIAAGLIAVRSGQGVDLVMVDVVLDIETFIDSLRSERIHTPFGSVTADDPAAVAKQLGVDLYPGARAIKGSAAVGFGGMQVAAGKFESDASPEKILEFYQRRYPKAAIRVIGADSSMVFSTDQGMITIKVRSRGDGSLIEIARVGGNGTGMDDGAKPN